MSDPFIGEIKLFAGNFAPRSFALCDGQLLAINQNGALFSLLGITYGGDGRTTFGLPDMRGRVPIHQGSGPGLTTRQIGQNAGSETAAVSVSALPSHDHAMQGSTDVAADTSPAGNVPGTGAGSNLYDIPAAADVVAMDVDAAGPSGGAGQNHNNIMPYLCVNFIIALTGIFPSRN